MYSELDYVNVCLGSMSEAPVPNLTIPHPYISQALMFLARWNKLVQAKRWWFNSTVELLTPVNPSWTVLASLPAGTLGLQGINGTALTLNADNTVYNSQTDEILTLPFEAIVVKEVAFVSLPVEANAYVADCAVLQFQTTYDGDSTRSTLLREAKAESWAALMAQNTRLMKPNMFLRGSVQSKLYDMRGDRPMLRGAE